MRFITHSKTRLYPPMAALSGLSGILPDAGVADDAGSIPILSLTAGVQSFGPRHGQGEAGIVLAWVRFALRRDFVFMTVAARANAGGSD
jgi:hypothetical protein